MACQQDGKSVQSSCPFAKTSGTDAGLRSFLFPKSPPVMLLMRDIIRDLYIHRLVQSILLP